MICKYVSCYKNCLPLTVGKNYSLIYQDKNEVFLFTDNHAIC